MGLNSLKMNLDYIRTFVVLGQSRNMTVAGNKLGVTVSYVSRHIKNLEDELNTKLIIPSPKNKDLQLTDAGKYFFDKYEKIYNEILLTEKEYKQSQELDNCKVTIGVCSDLEEKLIKPKLMKFITKFPNISIKIVNGDSEDLTKKLTQYAVDIIIDKNEPNSNSKMQVVDTCKLYESNYCFVYNNKMFKSISDISSIPLVLPINRTQDRILIDEYFESKGIVPNIKCEVENSERMVSYVKDGFGVGILLKDVIKDNDELSTTDMDIKSNICLSYIKEKITPSTKEFLKEFNIEL